MKGVFLLAGGVIIAFVSVAMLNVYRRIFAKPAHPQGQQVGVSVNANYELGAANAGGPGGSGISDFATDTIRSDGAGVDLNVARVASAAVSNVQARRGGYDKLPLVNNMEEEEEEDLHLDRRREFRDGAEQFSL
jgi:hypothetical protein